MSVAIVVGSEGQDGRILFERLSQSGMDVIGIGRDRARSSNGREIEAVDVTDLRAVTTMLDHLRPDTIYYLAAVHGSSQTGTSSGDSDLFARSCRVHVDGVVNMLDWMASNAGGSLFYAASSLVFGNPDTDLQTEDTPFRPESPYAITKTAGIHACRYFRDRYKVNASAGILYNHESPLRGDSFVSQKIATAAAGMAGGRKYPLVVGNLDARVDWGYAPDYVDAMIRIASLGSGDEFIIATGEAHTVREFAALAFARVGLDWKDHVTEDPSLLTRRDTVRVGDASRLRSRTGWTPSVTFGEMVHLMVDAAVERVS